MKVTNLLLDVDISIYDNAKCTEGKTITFYEYLEEVMLTDESSYRNIVSMYGKDSKEAKFYKSGSIPCVTPSGVFNERKDTGLVGDFTGIIVLDLDAKDNLDIDIDTVVKECRFMESTVAYHKSVSGEGYAIYVYVDKWAENTYRFAKDYYTVMLGVTFDKSTSNLSRLRYVSYDPDIWWSKTVEPLLIPEVVKKKKVPYKPSNKAREHNSDKVITDLIDVVISNGDDPTSDYADWFNLGCAIANGYGESGRDLFQKLSSNYHSYNPKEVDDKYDSILRLGNWKSGKGSIVYLLSKYQ